MLPDNYIPQRVPIAASLQISDSGMSMFDLGMHLLQLDVAPLSVPVEAMQPPKTVCGRFKHPRTLAVIKWFYERPGRRFTADDMLDYMLRVYDNKLSYTTLARALSDLAEDRCGILKKAVNHAYRHGVQTPKYLYWLNPDYPVKYLKEAITKNGKGD